MIFSCATAEAVVFTAQRYASEVYALVVCLSVCLSVRPSVTSRHCVETTRRTELVFVLACAFV